MDNRFIHNLKVPCKNRGITLTDNKDGTIMLDGLLFDTMQGAETYLAAKPRLDHTATELEMIEYCDSYACKDCPISYKCTLFYNLFGYSPDKKA